MAVAKPKASDSTRALQAGITVLKRSKSADGLTRKQIDSKAKSNGKAKTVSPSKMVSWLARQEEPTFNGWRVERPARGHYRATKQA